MKLIFFLLSSLLHFSSGVVINYTEPWNLTTRDVEGLGTDHDLRTIFICNPYLHRINSTNEIVDSIPNCQDLCDQDPACNWINYILSNTTCHFFSICENVPNIPALTMYTYAKIVHPHNLERTHVTPVGYHCDYYDPMFEIPPHTTITFQNNTNLLRNCLKATFDLSLPFKSRYFYMDDQNKCHIYDEHCIDFGSTVNDNHRVYYSVESTAGQSPTYSPTTRPTYSPSESPTVFIPGATPTGAPTLNPTSRQPTGAPSVHPSIAPTDRPTAGLGNSGDNTPTQQPSETSSSTTYYIIAGAGAGVVAVAIGIGLFVKSKQSASSKYTKF